MSLIVTVRYCSYPPHMSHSFGLRPRRSWTARALLALALATAAMPAVPAFADSGATTITGQVTFSTADGADRTLSVYRETAGDTWTEDPALETPVAADGSYVLRAPAGVPVRLRTSFGPGYGYWYGDVFSAELATSVTAAPGEQVDGIDLVVPVPVSYSGRLLDRRGNAVAGRVIPTVNTDGASQPLGAAVPVGADGLYEVVLPARHGGVYEDGVLGVDTSGVAAAWLGGGEGYEPDWYLNPLPGEVHTGEDITLPLGSAPSVVPVTGPTSNPPATNPPASNPPATTVRFRSTHSPVVRGAARRGARLHATSGRYTVRPAAVRYQWLRNGHAIKGAHRATYRLRKADVRKRVSVRVTAWRSGDRVRATSSRTRPVRRH